MMIQDTKVKVFSYIFSDDLETAINKFLEEKHAHIIHMRAYYNSHSAEHTVIINYCEIPRRLETELDK